MSKLIHPMVGRSQTEVHRQSSFLELFFDLVFVVAVASAAEALHHGIVDGHPVEASVGFVTVFFAIWWAWMNFTWFASAYDVDDVPYRLSVFLQMVGALVIAAGVEVAFADADFRTVVIGYTIIRSSQVTLWLRAAQGDPARRAGCRRYAGGLVAVQIAWIVLAFALPESLALVGWVVLVAAELVIPVWAERRAQTPFHPGHIAERYGLFTIIVLGESILSGAAAVQAADNVGLGAALPTLVGAVFTVLAMWWLYFDRNLNDERLLAQREAFTWGYGHGVLLGAIAAVGAGLIVAVEAISHPEEVSARTAGLAVAVPAALYLVCLWVLQEVPRRNRTTMVAFPLAAVLTILAGVGPSPVLVIGLILAALLALLLGVNHNETVAEGESPSVTAPG